MSKSDWVISVTIAVLAFLFWASVFYKHGLI